MKPLSEQTFYEILEVRADAPTAEIESAYARARELYGPGSLATYSLVAPEEAALLAARIEEAKRILLDPDARARYDAGLAAVAEAAETAVRIAATGSGAVAAGPQRPWVGQPTLTPRPPIPLPSEPPKATPEPAPAPEPRETAPEKGEAAEVEPATPAPREEAKGAEPAPEAVKEAGAPAPKQEPAQPRPAPILLRHEIPPEPSPALPVPEGSVWSGDALRKVRESRGLSVRELCERTKITRYHLENIEADRYSLLPAPVYLRGILVAVARELRLDGQKVSRSYLDRMAAGGGDPSRSR